MTLSANLTAGIDDNVYNSATSAVADEAVTFIPSVEGVLPLTRRTRIRATGGLAPHFFATEKIERHTDRFGRVGAELDVGPFSLFAVHGAGRFRQRFSLEIDERLVRRESLTTLGVTLRIRRITATASRGTMRSTFEPGRDAVDVRLDRDSRTDRFELALPVTRQTALVPSVDLIEDRFLHAVVGLSPKVRSERYRLALEFGKLAFISGRVAGGIRRIAPGQGVAPYTGPIVEVNAGMPFLLGTRLALDAKRDLTYAVTPAADQSRRNTAISSVYTGELQFALPWDSHARVFSSFSTFDYQSPTSVDGVAVDRDDRGWRHGGAMLRRFGEYLSIGVTAQRADRMSAVAGRSYRAWTYGLTGEFRY